ncbi:MAG: extracellular solute-binding protein [Patescibacteria group bacterium]
MQKKLIKIAAIIGGVILLWLLAFWIFGSNNNTPKTTLEFWNVFDTSDQMQPLLDDFTAQTDIRVNYRSFADLAEYRDALLIELASGEGPDVVAIRGTWFPKYKKFLQPLPETLGYTPESVRKDFVDAVGEATIFENSASKTATTEQVFGLPMYVDSLALFYNKTYFRSVLSKPYPAPETTWDGVRDDAMRLTKKDYTDPSGFRLVGIALGRADNVSRGVETFYNFYHQFGGENLLAGEGGFYKPALDALDFMTAFSRNPLNQEYCWNQKITAGAPEKELATFVEGKVAMIAGYSYYYDSIRNAIKQISSPISLDEVGIAPWPQIQDPQVGNPKVALADFFALAVAKSSKYPNEAWRLILDLTSNASESKYLEATKKPASRRDLLINQKGDPVLGVFADQAVYADSLILADDQIFDPKIAEVLDRIGDGELQTADGARELDATFRSVTDKKE